MLQGNFYHVYTKSIAGFGVFRRAKDIGRIVRAVHFYQYHPVPMPYSQFSRIEMAAGEKFYKTLEELSSSRQWSLRVKVHAYCVMKTHLHMIVEDFGGVASFMSDVLNSYSKYFNLKYGRKGPLWQGRFGRTAVDSVESLRKVGAYVFLNPVTERLIDLPELWGYSSYAVMKNSDGYGEFYRLVKMDKKSFHEYVLKEIDPRRELAKQKRARSTS